MGMRKRQSAGLVSQLRVAGLILIIAISASQAPAKSYVSHLKPPAIHDEQDPINDQTCSSLGQLDIAYQIGFGETPSLGLRVTDPRGRRFGYDPSSGHGWQEVPLAEGFVDCDENDDATGPANCTAHIQICGPISGAYKIDVLPARAGTYSLSITADSERKLHESGIRATGSWASDMGEVEAQLPKTLILIYSRTPGKGVELTQPAQASGAAWTGLH